MEMIVIYGLMVCACAFLAWRSGDLTLQKLSALITLDWALGNLSFQYLGPLDPWLAPSLGAIVAVLIGRLAIEQSSRTAWLAVLTFVAQETVAVVGFATHAQGSERYYILENLIFVIRVMIVGGSASYVLGARLRASDHRLGRSAVRREQNL